jgi:hypothetical protein
MGLGGKIENLYLPKYAETRERETGSCSRVCGGWKCIIYNPIARREDNNRRTFVVGASYGDDLLAFGRSLYSHKTING